MRFGSVCSGIEAASVAFAPLGWKAAWLAEIEPFPSAVLAHHYPDVPNLGDMTAIARRVLVGEVEAPDLLCGGTPCQAFSVAGLRRSLDDARGNLSLVFCEIANAIDSVRAARGEQPSVIFWENVPGLLSTKDNAFGCFLAGLAGEDVPLEPPGGKWTNAGCVLGPKRAVAWRTLDAQYFGLAQRRRRVFVVASARDGFDPATVLFEWDGLRRDSAPSREAGEGTAGAASPGIAFGGNNTAGPIDVATARNACASASGRMDFESETFLVQPIAAYSSSGAGYWREGIGALRGRQQDSHENVCCVTGDITHTLKAEGFDASEDGAGAVVFQPRHYSGRERMGGEPSDVCHTLSAQAGQGDSSPHVAYTTKLHNTGSNGRGTQEECTHTLDCAQGVAVAVAFTTEQTPKFNADCALTLTKQSPSGGGQIQSVLTDMQVRRLTPVECEKLQGFPPGYTAIPWRKKPASDCPDGPRYKALGNSWAVPCVRWIGRRIQHAIRAKELG